MSGVNQLKQEIQDNVGLIESTSLDKNVFDKLGVQVVRGAIPANLVSEWQEMWESFCKKRDGAARVLDNRFNPVEVKASLPEELYNISASDSLLDQVEKIFGKNIGLFHRRFVVKDKSSTGQIMLHQDTGYHYGSINKASLFMALSPVNKENGAMSLYPGTHRFGFLGDAGEINDKVLPEDWPVVCPELEPGDFLFMHSATWHFSTEFISGPDRVMTDFIYQDSADPSTIATVRGQEFWSEGSFLTKQRDQLFNQSRSKKLAAISNILNSTTK